MLVSANKIGNFETQFQSCKMSSKRKMPEVRVIFTALECGQRHSLEKKMNTPFFCDFFPKILKLVGNVFERCLGQWGFVGIDVFGGKWILTRSLGVLP